MSIFICVERFVDQDLGWNQEWFGRFAHEDVWGRCDRRHREGLTLFKDDRGLVVVDHSH